MGVLISSPSGLLVFQRATPPAGIAPVAGHLDQHPDLEHAARAEVAEEVGLTVVQLRPLLNQWRPNHCRRPPTGPAVGHHWSLFQAEVSGTLAPCAREVRAPRWSSPDQLQRHALRTAAHAAGHLNRQQFQQRPGLEPVWCRFLRTLGLITLPSTVLDRIEEIL
ncbi:NUDIX hydrolase [Actinomadura harenae]|uniref:NUDIX hydrolase n=1 Tax=Actinomadura harenae TaxID=2483351 RepID=UPI0018F345C5|nr:NUDIX hydrolase [Actinomadura harenae]